MMNKYRCALGIFVGLIVNLPSANKAWSSVEQVKPIEEVMVTARKREEDPLSVPIAITAFATQQLSDPTVNDISSLAELTPNLDFSVTSPLSGSSNAATVFIRGVGQNDFLLTSDPAVGIYLDGVYIARSIGGVLELADIERVEILRGPQGTLFGKNTIGGAVQVISRKPSEKTAVRGSVTLGDFNRRDIFQSVEGSIGEDVTARVSFLSEDRDGYALRLADSRELGNINRFTGRSMIVWDIQDNTELRFSIDHTHQRQEAIAQTLLEVVDTDTGNVFNNLPAQQTSGILWDDRWITDDPYTTLQTGPSRDDLDLTGASISLDYEMSWADLIAVTGYRHMTAVYSRDPDGSPLNWAHSVNRDNHDQLSQEIRLQSSSDASPIDWILGFYIFRENGRNITEVTLFEGLDFNFNVLNDVTTESIALFSQVDFHLTSKLDITAGLRLTYEDKDFFVDNRNVSTDTPIPVFPAQKVSEDWFNVSPMVSLDYQWTEQIMTYFSASRGFKSGGFNGRQISGDDGDNDGDDVDEFDPEFATSVELGVKSRLLDGRINLQASIFNIDYKDLQFTVLSVDDSGFLSPVLDNAAEARIRGFEVELAYEVTEGFLVNAGAGYLNAEYTEIDEGALITEDHDLVRAPEWSGHIRPAYRIKLKTGDLVFATSVSYRSKIYNDPLNVETIAQDDLTLVNASIAWENANGAWDVSLFVNNLTDELYLLSGVTELNSFGASEGYYGRPREWGLQVDYQF